MFGIVLGLSSGALFGAFAICIKIGMRHRPADNGLFMGVLITSVLSGVALLTVELPPWDWVGLALFAAAGIMTTFAARAMALVAIRRIGPAHQATVLSSAPLFAAFIGWVVLEEAVRPVQAVGGIAVLAGLLLLLTQSKEQEKFSTEDASPDDRADEVLAGAPVAISRRTATNGHLSGYLFGLTAALLFGAGYVVRKLGLTQYDSPVAGAFIGSIVSLALITLWAGLRGRFGVLVTDNLRNIPWWFVAGGIAAGIGLLAQFLALDYLAAWVVSLLQGTQVAWALLGSYLFLRRDELITKYLLVSALLIVFGIVAVTVGA